MFLSVDMLSASVLESALPPKIQHNFIQFSGNQYIDNMHLQNIELSDMNIEGITTKQTWGLNTLALADFENTLEAGNLINGGLPITSWRVRRKTSTDLLYTLLAEIPFSNINSSYIDYTGASGVNYQYTIYPVSNGLEGFGLGVDGLMSFFGWMLTDTSSTPVTTYNFDMSIKTDNIQTIQDLKIFPNYTQYPAVRFGQMQYREFTITTVPYQINGQDITIDNNLLTQLDIFINNKQEKILKNGSGLGMRGITHEMKVQYFDEASTDSVSNNQPYQISFKFTETSAL